MEAMTFYILKHSQEAAVEFCIAYFCIVLLKEYLLVFNIAFESYNFYYQC